MITGWLNAGQSPNGLGSYRSKYGTASAMRGTSADAMGALGFSKPASYQRYAGLPQTGVADIATINDLAAARGASSVSPLAGLRGPTGPSGPSTSASPVSAGGFYPGQQPSGPSILDTAPKALMPSGNAQQRWQAPEKDDGTGLKPLSDARRYFWATGQVDARAPQAANSYSPQPVTFNSGSQVGSGQPVTFNNSAPGHSDWQPY